MWYVVVVGIISWLILSPWVCLRVCVCVCSVALLVSLYSILHSTFSTILRALDNR
jgi:hypothetical protein